MIDAASGTLAFDRGAVEKELSRGRFIGSALARGATLEIDNGAYRTYQLAQPLELEGRPVTATLSFAGEALTGVSIALVDARFGSSFDDWSEAKERACQKEHTRWLRSTLGGAGPRWKLPWGVVESTYDPRSAGSSIEIRYAKPD